MCAIRARRRPIVGSLRSWMAIIALAVATIWSGLVFAAPAGGAAVLLPPQAPAPAPHWPLPLYPRYLTSNFMEHRDGRFHAGLDLKTDSRVGFPVLAAEDGWIGRVVTSAGGYGKAVYLTGASGRIYVYAHLQRFNDFIRPVVREAQQKRQRYRLDLTLKPDQLPVRRGQVLGLSGQSGTRGPHLHFEVRNSRNVPLNPLNCGFAVQDTFAPRILKIRALPAEAGARIAGSLSAHSLTSSSGLHGRVSTLPVSGAVAFTAHVQDKADVCGHRLEPYQLSVRLDGELVYRSRNETFAFSENSQMRLEWLQLNGARERWLHHRPQNRLAGRVGGPWFLQVSHLAPGRHRVSVTASDSAGNRTEVSWDLEVGGKSAPEGNGSGWVPDPIRLPLPLAATQRERWLTPFLEISRDEEGRWQAQPAVRNFAAPDTAARSTASTTEGEFVHGAARIFGPSTGDPLLAYAVLWAFPDSLTTPERATLRREQGLRSLGSAMRYVSADWPATGAVQVAWPALDTKADFSNRAAIYRQGESGHWELVERAEIPVEETELDWTFRLVKPGRHALLEDVTPPWIKARPDTVIVLAEETRAVKGVSPARWQILSVPVDDAGSGIDAYSAQVSCDGAPLIAEPDMPRKRLLVELPDRLAPGCHRLYVKIFDFSGQSSARDWVLLCQD